jgi:hypothetical protein
MNEADAVGLDLRFRGHQASHAPPDVAAFGRPAPPTAGHVHARPEEIAVLKGVQTHILREPLVVFFQHASFGIPPISQLGECLDLGSWSVRPTAFGYLACVPDTRREPNRARAAWVIAACLPLAMPNEVAAAPADKGAIQRPKSTRPVTPPPTVEAEPPTQPESQPESSPFDGTPPSETTDGPATESGEDVAPPPAPTVKSGPDREIVDAAWDGVDGFDVELRLKGGIRMHGRVGAVQRDTFTLIQAGTGSVVVLPKSGVVWLHVRTPPRIPDKTGTGLMAGGIVLTSIAGPIFISGVAMLAVCPSCTYIHLPLLIIGAGMLGGGIPMTVIGARRRQKYRKVMEERAISPIVVRTPHGWSGGLRFRF